MGRLQIKLFEVEPCNLHQVASLTEKMWLSTQSGGQVTKCIILQTNSFALGGDQLPPSVFDETNQQKNPKQNNDFFGAHIYFLKTKVVPVVLFIIWRAGTIRLRGRMHTRAYSRNESVKWKWTGMRWQQSPLPTFSKAHSPCASLFRSQAANDRHVGRRRGPFKWTPTWCAASSLCSSSAWPRASECICIALAQGRAIWQALQP